MQGESVRPLVNRLASTQHSSGRRRRGDEINEDALTRRLARSIQRAECCSPCSFCSLLANLTSDTEVRANAAAATLRLAAIKLRGC